MAFFLNGTTRFFFSNTSFSLNDPINTFEPKCFFLFLLCMNSHTSVTSWWCHPFSYIAFLCSRSFPSLSVAVQWKKMLPYKKWKSNSNVWHKRWLAEYKTINCYRQIMKKKSDIDYEISYIKIALLYFIGWPFCINSL